MIDALLLLFMAIELVGHGISLFLRLPETLAVDSDVAGSGGCGSLL